MDKEKRLIEVKSAWKKAQRIYSDPVLLHAIQNVLDETPTVDAVEVVHGRWVDTGKTFEDEKCRYNYWECSECNNQIAGRYGLHNYCPNCGARMDGGKDNG